MGNRVCKKCGLPANSHLLGAKERRHCLNHNKDIYRVCHDCDNSTHIVIILLYGSLQF